MFLRPEKIKDDVEQVAIAEYQRARWKGHLSGGNDLKVSNI